MTITNTQQILIPKKVYIGDTAELTINFNSSSEISGWNWTSSLNLKDYDIKDLQISKSGINYYQLVIKFTPWKTGTIDFPDLELITASVTDSLILVTDPIQIVSLVEQNQITGIQGAKNPMLIPGTTYKIYGFLITTVLLLLILIRALIKRKKIAQFIRERKLRRKYLKNKKKSLRALSNLLKNNNSRESLTDKEFSGAVQNIMRTYLEIRFEYPFTKAVSSSICKSFYDATSGLSEENKYDAVEEIEGIFIRTDYIRYGNGSLSSDERKQIIENLKNHIETLETLPPKVVDIH